MNETTMTALMSLVGTLLGTIGGITAGNKLTAFRLQRLEDKVNKHNCVIDRTYRLEGRMDAVERSVNDLKGEVHHG